MRRASWPSELDRQVDQARADLAGSMKAEPGTIEVVSAAMVVWPDSSLGCPKPGEHYLQVLTDGVRIVLELGDKRYTYHAAKGKPPFRCERPRRSADVMEHR